MNMYYNDIDEDPLLSSSPEPHPEELNTPTRLRRAPLSTDYSLSVPLSTIPESPDNSTAALESSFAFRIAPLPISGIRKWKAQMRDCPSLPVLPFATLGFHNPDAVPAFHRFKCIISASLFFDIGCLCDNNDVSGVNFGLAALQILLSQLTGIRDYGPVQVLCA
jgi:hypothetical protein